MQTTDNAQASRRRPGQWPEVREIALADLLEVLAAGLLDFRAAPLYGLGLAGIYAVGGWLLVLLLVAFDLPYLVYPLAIGFALIAPFVATGFYAVSRCLETGDPPSAQAIVRAVRAAFAGDLGWMALVTGFSLFIWVDVAAMLFFGFFGLRSFEIAELLALVFTTPMGLLFMLIGNTAGAVIALAVFSFSVVSFPMLFDRRVDFVTAMVTSVRLVRRNPRAMFVWCAIIAALIGLSLLSGLLALFAVLPLLGHASWHLYRRAVGPARVSA
ncbi:MAG: DUF2189 domain-containing protein [Alphaproteobacteria bacterium]|jgi:uncharacterized membrane protein|nr:DUF2189 domain-containing protein [Alphaproteobacteria bacterium]MDP6566087.1 DUF2189 domain-containing protein [Alphaproteobacteria bacterium]MDP6812913.1 DUF2189 domain-containing protein [Alphaproteobacteria bacterium]